VATHGYAPPPPPPTHLAHSSPPPPPVNQFGTPIGEVPVNQFGTPVEPSNLPQSGSPYATGGTPQAPSVYPDYQPDSRAGRRNNLAAWSYRLGTGALAAAVVSIVLYLIGVGGGLVALVVFVTAPTAIILGHIAWAGIKSGMVDEPRRARIGTLTGYGALLLNVVGTAIVVAQFIGTATSLFVPPEASDVDDIPFTEPTSLVAGDCVVPPYTSAELAGLDGLEDWAFQRVPCASEHWAEVFYATTVTSPAYPGDDYDGAWATCEVQYARYVGRDYYDASDGNWADAYFPSRTEWQTGERWLLCILETPTAVTGSQRGIG
jgi:hypothetical protein